MSPSEPTSSTNLAAAVRRDMIDAVEAYIASQIDQGFTTDQLAWGWCVDFNAHRNVVTYTATVYCYGNPGGDQ